jgi:hypothetical protein
LIAAAKKSAAAVEGFIEKYGGKLFEYIQEKLAQWLGHDSKLIELFPEGAGKASKQAGEFEIKEATSTSVKGGIPRITREQALKDLYEEARAAGIEIRTGPEADAFLDHAARMEGVPPESMHAVTLGDDLIMVREAYANDVRTLREELLHTQQQKPGFVASKESVTKAEIEVRELMIKNREKWGLTDSDVLQLIDEIRKIRERGIY